MAGGKPWLSPRTISSVFGPPERTLRQRRVTCRPALPVGLRRGLTQSVELRFIDRQRCAAWSIRFQRRGRRGDALGEGRGLSA
jgi:hypothetical protein